MKKTALEGLGGGFARQGHTCSAASPPEIAPDCRGRPLHISASKDRAHEKLDRKTLWAAFERSRGRAPVSSRTRGLVKATRWAGVRRWAALRDGWPHGRDCPLAEVTNTDCASRARTADWR